MDVIFVFVDLLLTFIALLRCLVPPPPVPLFWLLIHFPFQWPYTLFSQAKTKIMRFTLCSQIKTKISVFLSLFPDESQDHSFVFLLFLFLVHLLYSAGIFFFFILRPRPNPCMSSVFLFGSSSVPIFVCIYSSHFSVVVWLFLPVSARMKERRKTGLK